MKPAINARTVCSTLLERIKTIGLKGRGIPFLAVFALATLALLFFTSPLPYRLVLYDASNGAETKINDSTFFLFDSRPNRYLLKGLIYSAAPSQKWLHIITDDCLESLEINGEQISLAGVKAGRLCDWNRGFSFPIGDFLSPGRNSFSMTIHNASGPFSFQFHHSWRDPLFVALVSVFVLSLVGIGFICLRGNGYPAISMAILLGGLILQIFYLSQTDIKSRTYDVFEGGGHYDYIEYVSDNLSLPSPIAGWQYKHPPLYYIVGAALTRLCRLLDVSAISDCLQALSLVCYCGFLLAGISILRRTLNSPAILHLCTLLLVFWPSGIVHSARVGNDCLFYFLYALALRSLVIWWREDDLGHLKSAGVWAGAAILTKSNALAVIAVFLTGAAVGKFTARRQVPGRVACAVAAILLTALTLNLGDNIYYYLKDPNYNWLNSSIGGLNPALRVGNSPVNYLNFDLKGFLSNPFTSTWEDNLGRQSFLNFFLKTALFGEFSYAGSIRANCALGLSFLTLVLLLFFTVSLSTLTRSELKDDVITLSNLVFLIMAILYFRISSPFAPHADFRYIYPLLISFLAVIGWGLQKLSWAAHPVPLFLSWATAGLFSVLSVLFFAVQ